MVDRRFPGHPRVRVCGLLVRDGRVLLVRQRKAASTYWLLPGGGVDRGETIAAALRREFLEEVALGIVVRDPLGLIESISPDGGRSRHTIQLIYRVSVTVEPRPPGAGEPAAPVPTDAAICEAAWFTAEDLGSLALHPPIADLLRTWMGSADVAFVSAGARWAE